MLTPPFLVYINNVKIKNYGLSTVSIVTWSVYNMYTFK